MARKSLATWIDEAMRDSDKDGNISQLTLVHMVGQQQKEIHTTRFSSGKSWAAKDLAEMFKGKAETFCQDLPGVQTFQLLAFYGGRNQAESALPFIVNSLADHHQSGLSTESPTAEGRMMQNMRQSEMVFQQTYRRQQQQDEYTLRLLDIQNRMISETMTENREFFGMVKEMMTAAALNQHQHRMAELEYERSSTERKKFMTFVPPLINTILGREIFPQSTEDTALIESIAESLTEEDVMKVAGVVKPELLGPLMARVEKALVKKRKEEEHDRSLNKILARAGTSNPEADAAGD